MHLIQDFIWATGIEYSSEIISDKKLVNKLMEFYWFIESHIYTHK